MSAFDFGKAAAEEEPWHPRLQDQLAKGNWEVKITELDNVTSSGGFPMLKIKLENPQGVQWDNLVISPSEFSVAKLLGLIDSAHMSRPDPTKGEIDATTGKLSDAYANQFLGKTVGIVVRDEEDNREDHAGEWRPRVQGYVDPSILTSVTTGPLGGSTATPPPAKQTAGANSGGSKLAF